MVLSLLASSVSCVKEEYEISEDKINLEVNVFQEGVAIPLASTDSIKLKEIVSQLDEEYRQYLEALENGMYSLHIANTYDFSDSLSILKEAINIDDIVFSKEFEFNLSEVNVSEVKVDAIEKDYTEDLAGAISAPALPEINIDEEYSFAAEMYKYAFESPALDFPETSLDAVLVSLPEPVSLPEFLWSDQEIPIGELIEDLNVNITLEESFSPEPYTTTINMTFPKGLRSVKEVVMSENAKVRITLEMTQSLLTSGTINPYVSFDVSDIFNLTDSDTGSILADFEMPAAGGKIVKEYGIKSLVLNEEDWTTDSEGCLVLDKEINMSAVGAPKYDGIKTTTKHLATCGYTETLISLDVEFVDFTVDHVTVEFDPVELEKEQTISVPVDPVNLPEGIAGIEYIEFDEDSKIEFSLSAENVEKIKGLGLRLETLEVTFPEGMEVDGASDGKLAFSDVDLTKGDFEQEIRVRRFNLPAPVDGVISVGDLEIGVKAKAVIDGTVSTGDIPTTAADDLSLEIDAEASLEIGDYKVKLNAYEYKLDISEQIKQQVTASIAEIGEFVVYPEGDPVVRIDIELPNTSMPIGPMGDGVLITFPKMLRLKNLPAEYNYNETANSICFKGQLPEVIELPIDCLVVNLTEEDGKCYIMGDISVVGSVGFESCDLYKADVDAFLTEAKVGLKVHVPELAPSRVALDQYTSKIEQEMDLTLLKPGQIPEQIASVGRIELKDVYVNIGLDASSLPDLGDTDLNLDFKVDLPELLVLGEGSRDESGLLHITGSLDEEGKINLAPIKIEALDLSKVNLRSEEALVEKISVDGSVMLTNAELDIDEWLGKKHKVNFDASIKDIEIASISAKVDFGIDAIDQTIDLSEIKSTLNTENMEATIDLAHVHLALDLETNLGISADAAAQIIPYYGSQAGEVIPLDLAIEAAPSTAQPVKTKYWLGDKAECCPEGYTFKRIPVLDLLRDLPDSIKLVLEAGTDPNEECVLEPGADYILKADYALDIPLALGEKFKFEYSDTFADISPEISTIFRIGNLVLTGEIESSLPFELDLQAKLLDENGNVIELEEGSGQQIIKGCELDGSAVKTPLYLKMSKKKGVEIPDISAVELHFVARSAGNGAPITEDAFIKVALQALIPDGIHVDLKDFMNNENEEVE